jgi:hypothetical protein
MTVQVVTAVRRVNHDIAMGNPQRVMKNAGGIIVNQ